MSRYEEMSRGALIRAIEQAIQDRDVAQQSESELVQACADLDLKIDELSAEVQTLRSGDAALRAEIARLGAQILIEGKS